MSRSRELRELAVLFGTLGVIGFGGPAAHIALMRREVVERRRWLDDGELVDLVGLTSIIPGPNSTELAMLVGQRRAGLPGLLVAGLAFILPAAAIVLALAWAYVSYGSSPGGEALLYGVQPVVLAIIGVAIVSFARAALGTIAAAAIGLASAALWTLGVHELLLLFAAAVLMVAIRLPGWRAPAGLALPLASGVGHALTNGAADLWVLAGVFLKAGGLLFGSGYVLLAYLRGDLVERLGWLTDQQLLDAVAIGQITPGPLFTTATFIGYLLAGVAGAAVATVAIFLPGFVLAALIGRFGQRIRRHRLTAALLDGLNAASIGLMAAVTLQLGVGAIVDPLTAALALGGVIGLLWLRLPSWALVAIGAAAGLAAAALGIGP